MVPDADKVIQSCQSILSTVRDKSKEEINVLFIRIQYVVEEIQDHLQAITFRRRKYSATKISLERPL